MNDAFESLVSYLRDNWPELLWIGLAAGVATYLTGRRARLRWRERDFLDRLNVSLTSIDDGAMRIRTILEMDCSDVFLNATAAKNIVSFAKQTTQDDPMLPIPSDDCWQYLNAVLNEISERFAVGQLRRDMGLPVQRGAYVLCLTCERAGPVRTQKVRGMLLKKTLLMNLPKEEPQFESPSHITRWVTLQQLAEHYQSDSSRFIDIEICM